MPQTLKPPVTVVKIGGSLMKEENFPRWIAALKPFFRKNRAVLVHGGGKEVTAVAQKLGIESRFVNGRRFTDAPMMEVVEMVLTGKVNPFLVGHLNRAGIPAFGLSGRDGEIVRAKPVPDLGWVGEPHLVRTDRIGALHAQGLLPVFSSVAADARGGPLNINADDMASAIAVALRARRLVLLTDVPGILDAGGNTIPRITPADAKNLIANQVITGGMIPKIESAFAALKKGVGEIWILEGRLPVQKAAGTLLTRGHSSARHPFA